MAFADMPLYLDMTGTSMLVTGEPEAKKDQSGVQRSEKDTGRPMWVTQVLVQRPEKGYLISITTAGEKPDLIQMGPVNADKLEAIAWSTNGKSGIAYRAQKLTSVA
jgi:hypothetical protein